MHAAQRAAEYAQSRSSAEGGSITERRKRGRAAGEGRAAEGLSASRSKREAATRCRAFVAILQVRLGIRRTQTRQQKRLRHARGCRQRGAAPVPCL